MFFIALGQCNDAFVGLQEGASLTDQDGSMFLLFTLENPTEKEIDMIQNDPIEFRFCTKNDLPIMTARFGQEQWMDFTMYSETPVNLIEFEKDHGYGLTIVLANNIDGKVEALRVVGLSNEISTAMNEGLHNTSPVDIETFVSKVRAVQERFTSEQLAAQSAIRFSIK